MSVTGTSSMGKMLSFFPCMDPTHMGVPAVQGARHGLPCLPFIPGDGRCSTILCLQSDTAALQAASFYPISR